MTAKEEISVSELVLNLLKVARRAGSPITENDEREPEDIYYGVEQGENTTPETKLTDSKG